MDEEKIGWKCPICQKIYSPDVKECSKCSKKEQEESDGELLCG